MLYMANSVSQAAVVLLHTYWALAAAAVITTVLPLPVPQAFKDAVKLSAARGKLWQIKPKALGPLSDAAVPQSWFLHFYMVGLAVNLAVLLMYGLSCCLPAGSSIVLPTIEGAEALAALALFHLHLARRAAETALLMHYPRDARMHVIAYAFGLSYYIVAPLSLVPGSWYLEQGWRHLHRCGTLGQQLAALPGALLAHHAALHAAGVALFVAASALQFAAHWSLASLSAGKHDARHTYQIPKGPVFAWVSCPHYLGEVLLYLGLALLTRGRPIVCCIAVWVLVNLALAADATHRWYVEHFKTYPRGRRALVPFVF